LTKIFVLEQLNFSTIDMGEFASSSPVRRERDSGRRPPEKSQLMKGDTVFGGFIIIMYKGRYLDL
jgi:hypothetical protein